ncbi:uncharacterized protein LOC117113012 isoform X2 [Anneissia japonica]|uniref:uncharacterized protein LOC117113012 isoform X2 n=1 Tax=Anneissia japonica TaxID=1529436 RepID=UPI0014255372|nr:uncharacterized protein LOC117113012 isoform X2 [Anneissia japonica]
MIDDTIVEEMLEDIQEDEAKENKSTKCFNKEKAFNTPSTSILKPKFARRSLGMFTTPTAYYQDLLTDFGSVYGSKTSAVFRTPCKTSDNCSIKSQNKCKRIKSIYEESKMFDHCDMSVTILHSESESCRSGNDLPTDTKGDDPAKSIDFQESMFPLFVVPEEPEALEITTISEDYIEDRPTCSLSSNIKENTRLQECDNICHETHTDHDLESKEHCKSLNINNAGIRSPQFLKPHDDCKQDNGVNEKAIEHIPSIEHNTQSTFEIVHPKETITDYSKNTGKCLERNFESGNCGESTGNSQISKFPETENIGVSIDMVEGFSVIPQNVDEILEKDTENMGHKSAKGTSEEPASVPNVSSVVMTDSSQASNFLKAKNEDSQNTEDSGVHNLSSSIGVLNKLELENKDDVKRNFESEHSIESKGNSHIPEFPETENIVSIGMVKGITVIPQNFVDRLEKDTGSMEHNFTKGTIEEPASVPNVSTVVMTDSSQSSDFLETKNEDSQNTEDSGVSLSSSIGLLDKLEPDNKDGLERNFESENYIESSENSHIPEFPETENVVSIGMVKGISVIPQNVVDILENDNGSMEHKSTKGTTDNVPNVSSVVMTDSTQASNFVDTKNEDSQNTEDGVFSLSSIGVFDKFYNKGGLSDEVLPCCLSEKDIQKIDERRPMPTDEHLSEVDSVNDRIVENFSPEKSIELECSKVTDNLHYDQNKHFMCIVNKEKFNVDSSENCSSGTEITVHLQQLNDKADVKNDVDGYSKSDDYVAKCSESKNIVEFEAPVCPSTSETARQNILSSWNTTQSIYEGTNIEQGTIILEDTEFHLFNENTEKRKKKNGNRKGRRKSVRLQLKEMSSLSGGNCIQRDLASPMLQQYTEVDSYSTCMEKPVDLNDKNEQVLQKKKRGRPRKIKRGLTEPATTSPASNKFKRTCTSSSAFSPKENETSSNTVNTFQELSTSPNLFSPKETESFPDIGCSSVNTFSPKDAKGSSDAVSSFQKSCTSSHIFIPNENKTVDNSRDVDILCEFNGLDDLNIFKEVTETSTKGETKGKKASPVMHYCTEVGSSSTCMEKPVDLNDKNEQVLQKKKRGRPRKIKRGLTEPATTSPASNKLKKSCTSPSIVSPRETETSSDTVNTFQEPFSTSPNRFSSKETESSSDTGCTSVSTFSPKYAKGSSDADSSFQKQCTSSHVSIPKETKTVDYSLDADYFCELNGLDDLDIFKEVPETNTKRGTKKRRAKKLLVDEQKKSRRRSARLAGIPVQDNPLVIEQATEKHTDSCYSSEGLKDFGNIREKNSKSVKEEETLCHAVSQRKFRKIKRTSFGKPLLLMNTYETILEPTDEACDEESLQTVEEEVEKTDNGRLNMFVDVCEYTVPSEIKSDNETAPVFTDVDVPNVLESEIGKFEESSSTTASTTATDPPDVDVRVHSELDLPCNPEEGPPVKRLSSRRKRPVISKNVPKKKKKTLEIPQPMSTAEVQQLYLNRGRCPKVTKPNLLETIFEVSQNENGIKIGGKKLNRRMTFQCPWLPRKRSKKNKGKRLIGKNKKYKVSDQVLMDRLDSVLSDLDVYETLLL